MNYRTTIVTRLWMTMALVLCPLDAHADAFIPTMISANVLWLLVLPLVVAVEGWFMARWKWAEPYKYALWGNLWSMLAALPLGVGLSILGGYLSSKNAQTTLAFVPKSIRYWLAQTFLYGQLPAPSYGFIDGFGNAGIFLAALLFIGICWLLTLGVEGNYYRKKNPQLPVGKIFRCTALVNLVSYSLLLTLWIPYSYINAKSEQNFLKHICSQSNSWSSSCPDVLAKFPEVKEKRIVECRSRGISEDVCLKRRN